MQRGNMCCHAVQWGKHCTRGQSQGHIGISKETLMPVPMPTVGNDYPPEDVVYYMHGGGGKSISALPRETESYSPCPGHMTGQELGERT
ncbi:hypothetical protein XENTR_v10022942 [Xenopus tropicalis]|nr:hypothetical protein XENTR_v10022942 [Xenopus tropicalis]